MAHERTAILHILSSVLYLREISQSVFINPLTPLLAITRREERWSLFHLKRPHL